MLLGVRTHSKYFSILYFNYVAFAKSIPLHEGIYFNCMMPYKIMHGTVNVATSRARLHPVNTMQIESVVS